MHDVSVAQAVASEILKRAGGRKMREVEIDVSLGSLRFHDTGQVSFWLQEILRKDLGKGLLVKTNIDTIKPVIKCGCGFAGAVESAETAEELAHHGVFEMKCPRCGSGECEIEHGNECLVRRVKIR